MGSKPIDNDTAMEGIDPSAPEMTTPAPRPFFQNLEMRPQDQVVTLARAIGISPAIVSDPKANKPAAEVQDLISRLSLNATKAEDLAMASAASATNETQILTAASFKKLDDDIRTVHANVVIASEDARDSDGWMRWVRYEHDKEILQLKAKIEALIDIVMRNATESQKARLAEAEEECKRIVDEKGREYMGRQPTAADVGRSDDEYEGL